MAGVAGFEPTNAGIKIPCLTAWRYPNVLYLSKKWGERWESNPRPPGPQSGAPPIELLPPFFLARLKRLELLTPALEGRCSIQLSYRRILNFVSGSFSPTLNGAGDGNRTHAASLEGWNSTIELHPHKSLQTNANELYQND